MFINNISLIRNPLRLFVPYNFFNIAFNFEASLDPELKFPLLLNPTSNFLVCIKAPSNQDLGLNILPKGNANVSKGLCVRDMSSR